MKYSRFIAVVLIFVLIVGIFALSRGLGYIPNGIFAQLIGSAPRALLSVSPAASALGVGEEFIVSIRLSARTKVNVVDVTLHYPPTKLEPVHISKENSIANLWMGEPTIFEKSGTIQMTAGIVSTTGFSGEGNLLRVTFRAKSEGVVHVTLTDGSVLAHDGFGTNVLDELNNAEYRILVLPVRRSPFDLDNDGLLDLKDVRVFIDGWGKAYDPALDFNASRTVDFDDFLAIVRSVKP